MSETGNAKNIANFSQIISIVTGLGAVYNPSNSLIEIPNLQTKLTACQTAFDEVAPLDSSETLAINERQAVFEPLSKLVTSVTSAAAVSINDDLFSNDLRTIAHKLQGRRASARIEDDPATPDIGESAQSISTSQMSYDSRTEHFSEFITLLKTNGSYAPNEIELQIGTLETLLADMRAKRVAFA